MRTKAIPMLLVLGLGLLVLPLASAQAVKITNGPVVETAASNSATIAWSTNQPGGSRVWYGKNKDNLTHFAEAPYGGDTHRVQITNLQPDTTYYFQVESGQGRGANDAESQGVLSFRTVASGAQPEHNQHPQVAEKGLVNEENGKVRITNGPHVERADAHSATIVWTTNLKGSSRVNYGTDRNNMTRLAEAPWGEGGLNHRVTLQGLQPDTVYYYSVETGQAQGTGGAEVESVRVERFRTPSATATPASVR